MNGSIPESRPVRAAAVVLGVAAVYAAVAKASFAFTIPPGNITPIFPAAGVALVAAMMMGRRALAGIWLGSFVANTLSFFDGSMASVRAVLPNLTAGALIGIGAMSSAAAGAFLVRRLCRDEDPLESGQNVLVLVTVGALGCCLISPTLGVASLALGGNVPWERFGYSWATWWVGDAAGTLVAAPLILAWQRRHPFPRHPGRILEALVLAGTTLLVSHLVFFRHLHFEYGLLPLLLWAAFRFGMRGATTTAAVLALLAAIGTSRGSSAFVGATTNESLLLLNAFLGVTITSALFLAGLTEERTRAGALLSDLNRALRENEERLRLLGDNLPDSYVYQCTQEADGTPRFLHLSAGVQRLHGVKVEDVLRDATALRGQIAPEQVGALGAAEAASLRDMTDFTTEVRMRDAAGAWRWMRLCSRPRRAADGRVVWDGVATDITARKEAEAASHEAERRLADIIEFLPDATFVIDREKRVVAWNRACELMTGVRKDAVLGRGDHAYAEPFFGQRQPILIDLLDMPVPEVEERYKYVQRRGDRVYAESFIPRLNDGTGAHLWGVAAPLFDQAGQRCGAIEVIRDVTEQKRAEESLRDSEQKYRELVQLANSIILRWGRDGRINFLNEYGLHFFGYREDEIRGRHVIGTIVAESESSGRDLSKLMERICADPVAFEQNVNENVRRDGGRVWIAWTNRVVLDAQGQVREILSVGSDITTRKQAEEEVRRLNQDLQQYAEKLEQRVADRTAELAVAKDRAEAADRLKSAFLATMSHELRTPLNSIIGFTGIILQELAGPLSPEQRKQLEMVRGSARHLLALINDVLDISKIEAGQLEVTCEPFHLRESILRAAGIVKPMADKKGLLLQLEIAPEIGTWTSDQRRVEQILLNLLNNAVKFTDRGRVTLTAALAAGTLRMSVADTGIGIRAEDLEKLFQPFRQIDSGLTRQHEGTGLGLAICRRLAGLLGGEIRAESEWGKGSVFTVLLPGTDGRTP